MPNRKHDPAPPVSARRLKNTGGLLAQDASGQFTIKDPNGDAVLPLRGYGAFKDQYEVRAGMDITKPIAAQALRGLRG